MTIVAKDVTFKVKFDFESAKKQLEREASNRQNVPGQPKDSRASKMPLWEKAAIAKGLASGLSGGKKNLPLGWRMTPSGMVNRMGMRTKDLPDGGMNVTFIEKFANVTAFAARSPVRMAGGAIAKSAAAARASSAARVVTGAGVAKAAMKIAQSANVPGAGLLSKVVSWKGLGVAAVAAGTWEIVKFSEQVAFGTHALESMAETVRKSGVSLARQFTPAMYQLKYHGDIYKLGRGKGLNMSLFPGMRDPVESAAWNYSELEQSRDRCLSRRMKMGYGAKYEANVCGFFDQIGAGQAINSVFSSIKKWF